MWAPLQRDSQYVNVGCNTPNHMLAYGSVALKQRLYLVTVAGNFHHYTLRWSPCVITYNGSTGGFTFDLSLLPYIMAEVLNCWQVGRWIMWLPESIVIQWSFLYSVDNTTLFRHDIPNIALFICLLTWWLFVIQSFTLMSLAVSFRYNWKEPHTCMTFGTWCEKKQCHSDEMKSVNMKEEGFLKLFPFKGHY